MHSAVQHFTEEGLCVRRRGKYTARAEAWSMRAQALRPVQREGWSVGGIGTKECGQEGRRRSREALLCIEEGCGARRPHEGFLPSVAAGCVDSFPVSFLPGSASCPGSGL